MRLVGSAANRCVSGFNAKAREAVLIPKILALVSVISLGGVFLMAHDAHAMSFDQMKTLAGTRLLDLRVDAVLSDCGLPSEIADAPKYSPKRQAIRWKDVEMKLSPMEWEMVYSHQRTVASHRSGWINPASGSVTCLSDMSGLVLYTQGNAGFLTVKKRQDNSGYLTSYQVPDNLFVAHQVIGVSATWKQGMAVSRMQEQYGKPDQILDSEGGMKHYLYWVVVKQKEMPTSVYAVDFEGKGAQNILTTYTVHTKGYAFVQERLDELQRQWEKDYVLD